MEEFYSGFAQRARDLAEKADPFTRRRLLDLAKRYDGGVWPERPLRPPAHHSRHSRSAWWRGRSNSNRSRRRIWGRRGAGPA